MALKYHYAGLAASGISAFDIEVTQVRLGELALTSEAELGAVGVSGVWVDDPGATQDFVADKGWYVLDDAAPAGATLTGTLAKAAASATITGSSTLFTSELTVGREIAIPGGGGTDYLIVSAIASNTSLTVYDAPTRTATGQTATVAPMQRLWTGYVGDQKISRGAGRSGGGEPMGNGRDWSLDLADLNSALHFRIITGPKDAAHGVRPAETVAVRLAWLLTAAEVSGLIYDEGLVQYPTNALDAADLQGRFVDEILNEFSQVTGYNHGLYFHEATGHTCLYFDLDTSTRYSSPLRLSNDRADVSAGNAGPVWGAWSDDELRRSGRRVISGAYGPYSGGAEYRTQIATSYQFAARDGNAPNTNIKTAAAMDAYLDRYLADNSTQDRRLTATYTIPAAHVNDALPFQRIQVKQTHMPGLGSWTWCRILRRELRQRMADNGQPVPGLYDVKLELSPTANLPALVQNATAPCYEVIATAALTMTLPTAPTPGNLLVLSAVCSTGVANVYPPIPAGFTIFAQTFETSSYVYGLMAYRVVQGGDPATWGTAANVGPGRFFSLQEWANVGTPGAPAYGTLAGHGSYGPLVLSPAGTGLCLGLFAQTSGGHGALCDNPWPPGGYPTEPHWVANAPSTAIVAQDLTQFTLVAQSSGVLSANRSWFDYDAFGMAAMFPSI